MNTGGFALYTRAAREAPGGGNTVSAPALGPGVLRDSNRADYTNALRALLAQPIGAAALPPRDDSVAGFANIRCALGISRTTSFRSMLSTRFASPAGAMATSRSRSPARARRSAEPSFQKRAAAGSQQLDEIHLGLMA